MADYTNDFSLKFREGTTLDFPTYSIAVPDGFEAKTNVDGRDFVIYKRFDPDDEDSGCIVNNDGQIVLILHFIRNMEEFSSKPFIC